MPSFLSKVFGRKKQDDKDSSGHGSDPSLLEGKFEAVSPNVSPTAEKFVDGTSTKDKEDKQKPKDKGKESPFSLLRSKSATSSPDITTPKSESFSHLTLNLPGLKDDDSARALGVVFEADPSQLVLSDAIIGSRRLTSLETLILVRACSQAIMARGLETLGIMHPHWHSSSPEVQRKLISLFIHSLAPKSPITTLSPTLSAPTSTFESEINSTRSPHDVAAVLRWGLRHMQLDSFGKDDDWYKSFFEAEKSAQYPPTAFSDLLAPKIPATHLGLLTATLDLFSSLAAHAEANSISGSKLSKLLGLWLLTADRTQPGEDWHSFYSRWDKMGRMLEHLFLSHIRNEAANHRMPKRLMELVQHYPYVKGSPPSPDHDLLLPRPRFSTQRYDAIFVRVDSELPSGFSEDKSASPDLLKLLTNALKADATGTGAPYELWQKVKLAVVEDETANEQGALTSSPSVKAAENLSRILADETIRLLSLRNTKQQQSAAAQEFKLDMGALPTGRVNGHSKSASVDHTANGNGNALKHGPSTSEGASSSSPPSAFPMQNNALGIDWTQFSRSGFLESSVGTPLAATLMDRDVEVSTPKEKRSRSLGRRSRPTSPRRSTKTTTELPPLAIPSGEKEVNDKSQSEAFNNSQLPTKVTQVSFLQLDEAFIDFWSDALVDPISSDWPRFIICRFKNSVLPGLEVVSEGEGNEGKKLEWMVVEQVYSKPVSASQPVTGGTSDSTHETSGVERRGRPSSPRPSFSSARQRFSIFSSTFGSKSKAEKEKDKEPKKKDKGDKGVKIGEMGEILKEEDEGEKEVKKEKDTKKRLSWIAKKSVDKEKEKEKEQEIKKEDGSSVPVADIAAAATGAVAVAGVATVISATQSDEAKEGNEGGDKVEEKPIEAKEEQPAVIAKPAGSVDEESAALPVPAPEPKDVAAKEQDPVVTTAPELPEPVPAGAVEEEKPVEEKIVEEPVTAVTEDEKLVEEVPAEPEPTPAPESEPIVEAVSVAEEVPVDEEKIAEEPVAVAEPEPVPTPEPEPTVEAAQVIEEVPTEEHIAVEPEPTSVPESEPAVETTPVVEEEQAAAEPESAPIEVPSSVVKEEEETVEEPITAAEPTTNEPAVAKVERSEPAAPAPTQELLDEVSTPETVTAPEQAKPVEAILIEYAPIIADDAIIPPVTTSSDNVLEPTDSNVPTQSPSELVASFAETTAGKEDTVHVPPVQVHVEPLREPSPGPAEDIQVSLPAVPVVEAEIPVSEPSADAPSVDLIGDTPSPEAVEPTSEVAESGPPPAPESVVASGNTPGPQVALNSSEPAAAALIEAESEKESEPQVPPGLGDASEKLATDVADAKDVASSEAKEASSGEPEAHEKAELTPAS